MPAIGSSSFSVLKEYKTLLKMSALGSSSFSVLQKYKTLLSGLGSYKSFSVPPSRQNPAERTVSTLCKIWRQGNILNFYII